MGKKLGMRLLAATAALGIGWTGLGGAGAERPLAAPAAMSAAHAAGGEPAGQAASAAQRTSARTVAAGDAAALAAAVAPPASGRAVAAGDAAALAAAVAPPASGRATGGASPAQAIAAAGSPRPEIGGAELLEALRQAAPGGLPQTAPGTAAAAGAGKGAGTGAGTDAQAEPPSPASAQAASAKEARSAAGASAAAAAKTVYLTFDDGPSEHTAQVLDILREQGIKATFFMMGRQVKAHPELVQRAREEGHAIGNHSYDHDYKQLYGSFQGYARQTLLTEQALLDAGVATTLVRAPGGTYTNFDDGYFRAMREAGYTMADWNVDSGDSKRVGVPAAEIAAGATSAALKREMTVLLHDGTGHGESVKALPAIIAFYQARGYRFAALDGSGEAPVFPVAAKLKWKRETPKAAEIAALAARSRELRRSPEWLAAAADSVPAWGGGVKPSGGAAEPERSGTGSGKAGSGPSGTEPSKAGTSGSAVQGGKAEEAEKAEKADAAAGKEARSETDAASKTYGTQLADLRLHSASGEVRITYGEYRIVEGGLYVPVRRVAEALGGRVEWNGSQRTAIVHAPAGEAAALEAETAFRDAAGTLYAPLEELLRLLGDPLQRLEKSPGSVDGWLRSAADGDGMDGEGAGEHPEAAPGVREPAPADEA
ncbi:polysaccharide deacetylase family protein [Paenibacillus albicereus]|uniref:Polysaccharide deacetylase family protein n=1 Tax=Paenibacillus albicereus TaxID=2726185 RepID=A0A6H2H1R0_9BACL|nr:polysaccharide deacetylase [Paenibacillus albicereus]QJC53587.1 polysaccharide deacetylase family protein [Paenibacillus albicereus]